MVIIHIVHLPMVWLDEALQEAPTDNDTEENWEEVACGVVKSDGGLKYPVAIEGKLLEKVAAAISYGVYGILDLLTSGDSSHW